MYVEKSVPVKYSTMALVALLLVSVLFVASGCFLLPKEEEILAPPIMEPPEITYKTYPVKRGTIEDSIRVTGYFVYAEQHSVSFKSRTGRLAAIPISYGQIVGEGDVLAELETDNLLLQIQQQEIQLQKAQLGLERSKLMGADKYALQIAELDLELVQLRLQELRNNLESARLRSPMDGEVVYIANVSEGSFINAYQTIAQIADRSKLYLSYAGNQLSEFRLSMKVNVIIEREPYPGEVVMTPAQFPYDAPDSQKRQIYVEVENLPEETVKGDSAVIYLILQRSDDTLIIPRSQVQHYMGRTYVYVLDEGVREERNIATGIQNATEVEVTEGLEEGELIVLR